MTAYLLANHVLNFIAPAAFMAALLVASSQLFSRFFGSKRPFTHSWRAQLAINFVVGMMVLVAALVLLGRDGKMLTYLLLALATGACQWWQLGGWKT